MARVSALGRNHRYQTKSKAKIQGRTRSSPRFRGTASNTHPSTSPVTPPPVVDDKVPITSAFASKLRMPDGTPKTLMGLLDESEGGIVVWTFKPRAEDEACDFAAEILSSYHDTSRANMTYYGLTTSSAATNASLQERRDEIDCDLLSDPGGKMLRAMGYIDLKGQVKRGAFVIAKDRRLLLRRTGGTMIHVADGVYRVLKAVVKANTVVGGVKVPF
ncbi:hypothetical protein V502_06854 [Pseudogymnoascus sp. VKM F-4520 (FW-2644)]|nr:hypothetical protein V502_06854 [Pseudogymnoascus sp. VKM F-4520 (FW-2644)]